MPAHLDLLSVPSDDGKLLAYSHLEHHDSSSLVFLSLKLTTNCKLFIQINKILTRKQYNLTTSYNSE
ncbi:unnamed protein product [Rhizophagus irregularis]|nr:unnamed protein product [Rhizophagus irregularis]